jgi:hypothetical protein
MNRKFPAIQQNRQNVILFHDTIPLINKNNLTILKICIIILKISLLLIQIRINLVLSR